MLLYRATIFSHIGNSRENQEDNFLVGKQAMLTPAERESMAVSRECYYKQMDIQEPTFGAAVCDGMGGHACGETASLTAVQLLQQKYDLLLQAADQGVSAVQDVIAGLNEMFCQTAEASPELRSMGTTLCGVVAANNAVYGVNAGDSRLYLYREGRLSQVSTDHSEGQRMLAMGLLTAEEVQRLPAKKAIYRYIGQQGDMRADVFELPDLVKRDLLLITSDGLTDVLADDEIRDVLANQELSRKQQGELLLNMALVRKQGLGDNITFVLLERVENDKQPHKENTRTRKTVHRTAKSARLFRLILVSALVVISFLFGCLFAKWKLSDVNVSKEPVLTAVPVVSSRPVCTPSVQNADRASRLQMLAPAKGMYFCASEDDEIAVIRSRFLDAEVEAVPKAAFMKNKWIKQVFIEDGIVCIDDFAFYDAKDLQMVVIPASVSYIEMDAFSGCKD